MPTWKQSLESEREGSYRGGMDGLGEGKAKSTGGRSSLEFAGGVGVGVGSCVGNWIAPLDGSSDGAVPVAGVLNGVQAVYGKAEGIAWESGISCLTLERAA